jgi:uncharacterized cysteine cluster protein YcgN (CxxCxxCC family)
MKNLRYWEHIPLDQLSREQWESLCDGCGKCCLHKLEDEETREIHFTNVVCDLLDLETCRCTHYTDRSTRVPTCVTLTPDQLRDPYWLPTSCAYRLLAQGKPLADWHPLISGTPSSVEHSGNSVKGRVIRESDADELEYHLASWP